MVTLAMSFTSCYPRLGEISRIGVQLGYIAQRKINGDTNAVAKLAAALNRKDPLVAEAAANALARQGEKALPAVPSLITCLQGSNMEAKVTSCQVLANLKAKEAISGLQELAKSTDHYVRGFAESPLKEINAPSDEERREQQVKAHTQEEENYRSTASNRRRSSQTQDGGDKAGKFRG